MWSPGRCCLRLQGLRVKLNWTYMSHGRPCHVVCTMVFHLACLRETQCARRLWFSSWPQLPAAVGAMCGSHRVSTLFRAQQTAFAVVLG
jgi:hypothetical protein